MDLLIQPQDHEFKMVFVVNNQLDMGRGKQCAQVAHAAVTLSIELMSLGDEDSSVRFHLWFTGGQKKIVLKGDNLEQMTRIQAQASGAGLPNHMVADAGHTQIAPGSKTVLAIFGTNQQLDAITGSLRLL